MKTLRFFTSLTFTALAALTHTATAGPADLDLSFGGTGQVTTSISGDLEYARDYSRGVAMQSDGRILLVGTAYRTNGGQNLVTLVRYNANGSLDTTFNGTGIVTTAFPNAGREGRGLVVQSDGKIIVVANGGMTLLRYNTDGSLDTRAYPKTSFMNNIVQVRWTKP